MAFTQLTQQLPVLIVGKGKGTAIAVIDYGPEANLIWVTALEDSGELWCAPNPLVRLRANWTAGRGAPSLPDPVIAEGTDPLHLVAGTDTASDRRMSAESCSVNPRAA